MLEVKDNITMAIRCQSAESGPPIGTVLGNLGVNSVKFCQQFNELTSDLPAYLVVRVAIKVFENKSFTFSIKDPSIGFILSLFRNEEEIELEDGSILSNNYIMLSEVIKLALFKFHGSELSRSVPIVIACAQSCSLVVVNDLEIID